MSAEIMVHKAHGPEAEQRPEAVEATAMGPVVTKPGPDSLSLKWGTIKAWDLVSEAARAAGQKYFDIGNHAAGAMQQRDTDEQRQALCDLIDAIDGTIRNDWTGDYMTADEAKAYVTEYRG